LITEQRTNRWYDYQSDEFLSSNDAFDFARKTARSLKNKLDGGWLGWTVEVRDAQGRKYVSFPVGPGDAVVA
jgi:hypothetical protein